MPDSRLQLDSSAPIDFGTPFASHQLQRQDFTFAAEQSPAPSLFAMPGQTPHSRAGAGGSVGGQRSLPMHEDDLERFEEEDAEGETDSIAGLAELYKKTAAGAGGIGLDRGSTSAPALVEPLSEFVVSSLSHYIEQFAEDAETMTAVNRTFLLLHLLLHDAAATPSLWPISARLDRPGDNRTDVTARTFADIAARLDPSCAFSNLEGGAVFDAALCHLRRILFWLEITASSNAADERMQDLYRGLMAFRDDQHRAAADTAADGQCRLQLAACVNKMALLDMSQLIWLHLRRGELAMAQERCRLASDGAHIQGKEARHLGGRQWWRASMLEGARFAFEQSQRAAFSTSEYSQWYDKRYTESYGPYNLDKALAGTHCAAPIMSQAGWRRYSSTCLSLCRANQDLLQSSGTDDRGAKIRAGFDMAVFAVLAGHPCLPEDASDSNATSAGLRHGSFLADADPRASLRDIGVLEHWEDELWLELRGLFTGEMKRTFEMQSALEKPLISKILGAVKKVETAVSSYDGAGPLGRWGVAGMLGAIQRYVIAADLSGLVSYLDRESAAVLKQLEGEQAVLVLGVFAHVCFAFKVTLFLHGGQALVDGQDAVTVVPGLLGQDKWRDKMVGVLQAMDNVCDTYVQALIGVGSLIDVPVTLGLMKNHPVDATGPLSGPFNAILEGLATSNAERVHQLAVKYLQAVEERVSDGDRRRTFMDRLMMWVGAEAFQAAGNQVVASFDTCSDTIDLGERLHEIFQPGYGHWHEGVNQAHSFLRSFLQSGDARKVSDVSARLLLLVKSTSDEGSGSAWESGKGGLYGCKELLGVVNDLTVLHGDSSFGPQWEVTLTRVLNLKTKADLRMQSYMAERVENPLADAASTSAQALTSLLESLVPLANGGGGMVGGGGIQARLDTIKAALPLGRNPKAVGINASSVIVGQVGWSGERAGGEENGQETVWAALDAAGLYVAALQHVRVLKQDTPARFQARVAQLGLLVLQLARVACWAVVADVCEGNLERSSATAWREAYARVVRGDASAHAAVHLLDLAGTMRLYRIVGLLRLRPVWRAMDELLPEFQVVGCLDLGTVCAPMVEQLMGYQVDSRTRRVAAVNDAYMAVIRTCLNSRILDLVRKTGQSAWAKRWCAHAVGLGALAADPALGLVDDLSSESLQELLHSDLPLFSLHLYCGAPGAAEP